MSKKIFSATNEFEYSRSGGGEFYYTIRDGKCIIDRYMEAELIIPSEIKGVPVTEIGDSAFAGCKGLIDVTIPDSVKVIGYGAFWACEKLRSVSVPKSVEIVEGAFEGCPNIRLRRR